MIKEIFLLFLGALIGIFSTFFVEHKKRLREKNEQIEHGRKLLKAIIEEVKMGINRCEYLAKNISSASPSISFSRIYTGLWDSTLPELAKSIEDLEIIRILDNIYYYFDLVNFNMNRNEFGIGAAFARDKLLNLKDNLRNLEMKKNQIPKRVFINRNLIKQALRKFELFIKKI